MPKTRAASGSMNAFSRALDPGGFAQAERRENGEVECGVGARTPEKFVRDEIGLADAERQRQHHALAHAPQRLFHDLSDVIKHLRHDGLHLHAVPVWSMQRGAMNLKKPALDPMSLAPRISSGYPEPYRSRVLPREKRQLGDALGLTKIGINHTTLLPGKESSMRHWHTHRRRIHLRVVRRGRGEDRRRRAGAREPACARDFRPRRMARPATATSSINRGARARGLSGDQQPRQGGPGRSTRTSTCISTATAPR